VPVYIKWKEKRRIPFSKKNVFLRDQLTCQYCGKQEQEPRKLTYDHVISRATWKKKRYNGTPTHWGNIVCCCVSCNRRKADRSLAEANMKLLREPKEPNAHQYILGITPWNTKIHESWYEYLTPMYKEILQMMETKQ